MPDLPELPVDDTPPAELDPLAENHGSLPEGVADENG